MINPNGPKQALELAASCPSTQFPSFLANHPDMKLDTIVDKNEQTTALMILSGRYRGDTKITLFKQSQESIPGLDMQNKDGDSALMIAARNDHFDNVIYLRKQNASTAFKNKKNETVFTILEQKMSDSAYAHDPAIADKLSKAYKQLHIETRARAPAPAPKEEASADGRAAVEAVKSDADKTAASSLQSREAALADGRAAVEAVRAAMQKAAANKDTAKIAPNVGAKNAPKNDAAKEAAREAVRQLALQKIAAKKEAARIAEEKAAAKMAAKEALVKVAAAKEAAAKEATQKAKDKMAAEAKATSQKVVAEKAAAEKVAEEMAAAKKAGEEKAYNDIVTAIVSRDEQALATLLALGLDPNTTMRDGKTLLMAASIYENGPGKINLLIKAGANVNTQASDGCTALMAAAISGNSKNVEILLKNNADQSLKFKMGPTALELITMTLAKENTKPLPDPQRIRSLQSVIGAFGNASKAAALKKQLEFFQKENEAVQLLKQFETRKKEDETAQLLATFLPSGTILGKRLNGNDNEQDRSKRYKND